MILANVIVVLVITASVAGSGFLALLGWKFITREVPCDLKTNIVTSSVSIIIPSLGGGCQLDACLVALSRNMPAVVEKVTVILQGASQCAVDGIRAGWGSSVELEVWEVKGTQSKSTAINLGLQSVSTGWVLLLDSDTQVGPHIHRLFDSLSDTDAVYGMILPVDKGADQLLDRVIKADKVVSHGVWRLGRFIAGLWPNLPGQCYAIRTEMLQAIYDQQMGHLDDMAVTMKLAARGARIKFVPAVVCFEEGRSTWLGLFSQRARWTIGLAQAISKSLASRNNRVDVIACWIIHSWIYLGWPLFTSAVCIALVALGSPFCALAVVLSFLITWSLLVMAGNRVFTHLDTNYAPVRFASSAFPASCLILLAQTLGFLAAPCFLLVYAVRPHFGNRVLYRR